MKQLLPLTFTLFAFFQMSFGQPTYQKVYSLFQANCTTGYHSGPSHSANLDLGSSEAQVYHKIVGGTPVNPFAATTLKQKLVDPGYPERSYLNVHDF